MSRLDYKINQMGDHEHKLGERSQTRVKLSKEPNQNG